jgi:hypothetical protein
LKKASGSSFSLGRFRHQQFYTVAIEQLHHAQYDPLCGGMQHFWTVSYEANAKAQRCECRCGAAK